MKRLGENLKLGDQFPLSICKYAPAQYGIGYGCVWECVYLESQFVVLFFFA